MDSPPGARLQGALGITSAVACPKTKGEKGTDSQSE